MGDDMTTSLEVIAYLYLISLVPDEDRSKKETLAIQGCARRLIILTKMGKDITKVKNVAPSMSAENRKFLYEWLELFEIEIDIVMEYLKRKSQ